MNKKIRIMIGLLIGVLIGLVVYVGQFLGSCIVEAKGWLIDFAAKRKVK